VANTQVKLPLLIAGNGSGKVPRTEIITNNVDRLLKAYGMEGRSTLPAVNAEIRPEDDN